MSRALVVAFCALTLAACDSPPLVDPPAEPWGTYDYTGDGFNGGWFALAPGGGDCEMEFSNGEVWPCIVTGVSQAGTSVRFRLTAPEFPQYYHRHEAEWSEADGTLAGTWELSLPPAPGYEAGGAFTAVLR